MEIKKYNSLQNDIKEEIRRSQIKTIVSANTEMIVLYWKIGRHIYQQQQEKGWSAGVIPQLSKDLKKEFPEAKGYSERNLGYMLKFAKEYNDISILQQAVAKLPKGILINFNTKNIFYEGQRTYVTKGYETLPDE